MEEILTAVLAIVALSAALALLLVLADALLMNYGECVITINASDKKSVRGGKTLLASLMDQGVFIPSACGGRGSCGLCKVKVMEGGGQLLPTELPHLTELEIKDEVRISCQLRVRSDMAIELPEEILRVKEYQAVAERIQDLNYDTKLIVLRLTRPGEISFRAGQYIQLETPPYGKTAEPVYRAYSVASSPSVRDQLELIIRLVPSGICTTYVFQVLKHGDGIKLNGPYGRFCLKDTDREIVFIAGGSGIAPIRSMLFRMAEEQNPRKATFYYGANELRDLYLVDEMRGFERRMPHFAYVPALARAKAEDNWRGEKGLVTEVVDRYVKDASTQEVYLCGGPNMIDAAIALLRTKGLTEDRVFFDKFA